MTETAIIEAVRGAGGVQPAGPLEAAATVADPSAVARFEAALAPSAPMEIPFAGQVAATFNAAHERRGGKAGEIASDTASDCRDNVVPPEARPNESAPKTSHSRYRLVLLSRRNHIKRRRDKAFRPQCRDIRVRDIGRSAEKRA